MSVFDQKISAADQIALSRPFITTIHAVIDGKELSFPAARAALSVGDTIDAVYSAAIPAGHISRVGIGTEEGCLSSSDVTLDTGVPTEIRVSVSVFRPDGMPKRANPLAEALVGGVCNLSGVTLNCTRDVLTIDGEQASSDGVLCLKNTATTESVTLSGDATRVTTARRPTDVSYDPIFSETPIAVPDFDRLTTEGVPYRLSGAHIAETCGYKIAEYGILFVDSTDGIPYLLAKRGIVSPLTGQVIPIDTTSARAFASFKMKGQLRFAVTNASGLTVYDGSGAALYTCVGDFNRLTASEDYVLAHMGEYGVWLSDTLTPMNIDYLYALLVGSPKGAEGFAAGAYYRYNPAIGTGVRLDIDENRSCAIYSPEVLTAATDGRTLAVPNGEVLTVTDLKTNAKSIYTPFVGNIGRVEVTKRGLFVKGVKGAAVFLPSGYDAFAPDGAASIESGFQTTVISLEEGHNV